MKMKTAVGYSRYSSISQGDGSTIQTQQEAIKEYCYAHNMNLLKHYSDLAISGKDTEHRTQFKEMIKDITLGEINAVVVYTRDRFSRSIKDFIKYLQIMSDYNCELYVVKENGDVNTPSGQLSAWILMSLAEYYIKNLNREVIRGLRYNAHHCLWNGSVLPFGYDKDKSGRLIINDGEANIVRIIYNLYLQDYSPKEIEVYLKDKEYHRKDGREILHSTVEKVLKRRTYLGEYSYNIKAGDNPEEIIIPDGVPRIIEDDIFEQVQNKILERSKKMIYNHSDIEKGLLVGKIKCGYTGFNMICSASKVNMELRTENSYYTCCAREKNPTGKYGATSGVTVARNDKPFKSKYYETDMRYKTPNGFLYPILGAFRALLEEKNGVYTWKKNPFDVMDDVGPMLVNTTIERSRSLGNNPQSVGKDTGNWQTLYMFVMLAAQR